MCEKTEKRYVIELVLLVIYIPLKLLYHYYLSRKKLIFLQNFRPNLCDSSKISDPNTVTYPKYQTLILWPIPNSRPKYCDWSKIPDPNTVTNPKFQTHFLWFIQNFRPILCDSSKIPDPFSVIHPKFQTLLKWDKSWCKISRLTKLIRSVQGWPKDASLQKSLKKHPWTLLIFLSACWFCISFYPFLVTENGSGILNESQKMGLEFWMNHRKWVWNFG